MKTKNIVSWFRVLITFILISASSLKAEWLNVNHHYTAQNLNNIFSYNSDINIVLVNNGYSYLKTTNGGLNYSLGQISSSIYIKNIKILNANVYLALTNSGLYKTTNSGLSWFTMNSPNATYSSIEFLNDTTFYLCINPGSLATLYKTTNAGINWVQKNCPSNVSGISFVSEDIGFLTSFSNPYSFNGVWKTTDGALTWQSFNIPWTSFQLWRFISPSTGFCETNVALFRTSNTGVSWDTIQKSAYVDQIYFTNSNTGFYSGYRGVYKTTNSGINFFSILNRSSEGSGVSSYDGNIIFTSSDAGVIRKSSNSGLNWNTISKKWDLGYSFIDIYLNNSGKGYIFNDHGAILKTENFGNNWSLDTTSLTRAIGVKSASFINQDTGYILFQYFNSNRSGILRTRDGCNSFDTIPVIYENSYYQNVDKIFMYSKDIGIYSSNRNIYYTSNGGNNWNLAIPSAPTDYFIWGFSIASGDTVFSTRWKTKSSISPVNANSTIYRSVNKGCNWSTVSYFEGVKILECYFINGATGYFAGSGNFYFDPIYFWKTTNSGTTLTQLPVSLSSYISDYRDIYFPNANTGYLLPYRTTNQGNNWSVIMPSGPTQRRIKFINSNTGFIVGDGDIIYKTTDGGGTTFAGNNNQTVALKYELSQNYPNPFNPVTKIKFVVPKQGLVEIKVFDILGREVKILMNENLKPGTYETSFDGSQFANGIYFYRMTTENISITKRMVFIK